MLSALGSGATNVRQTVGQVLNFALVLSTGKPQTHHSYWNNKADRFQLSCYGITSPFPLYIRIDSYPQ